MARSGPDGDGVADDGRVVVGAGDPADIDERLEVLVGAGAVKVGGHSAVPSGRGHGGTGFGPLPLHGASHCSAISRATRSVPSGRVIRASRRGSYLSACSTVTVTAVPAGSRAARLSRASGPPGWASSRALQPASRIGTSCAHSATPSSGFVARSRETARESPSWTWETTAEVGADRRASSTTHPRLSPVSGMAFSRYPAG